jgi:NAD(P)H dehydrogenase (quinone)
VRALVVHAHPDPDSFSAAVVGAIEQGLRNGGHESRIVDLYGEGFTTAMTNAERLAYHEDEPIVDDQVRAYAAHVRWADALIFVYPTWWAGMPAVMKGWLERVLVPGVAFRLDEHGKVRPGLRHARRLVGVSTYGSRRLYVALMNDGGRRTINRTLRLSCGWRTRTTWLGLYDMDHSTAEERRAFLAKVEHTMGQLR